MKKIMAIKDQKGLCWKCLKMYWKENINVIKIKSIEYGSRFDYDKDLELHLCHDCYCESIEDNSFLWDMEVKEIPVSKNIIMKEYKYESQMIDYIESLPIEGQQLYYNEVNNIDPKMKPQDWIDYQLNNLSDKKMKEYGYYL